MSEDNNKQTEQAKRQAERQAEQKPQGNPGNSKPNDVVFASRTPARFR